MSLIEFLKEHSVQSSEKAITHISTNGGKYNIPLSENKYFLELYLNHIIEQNPLEQGAKKLYISECILPGKLFNLMLDIEFKPEYRENYSDDKIKNEIIYETINEIKKLIFENTGEEAEEIITSRAPYLFHIYFENTLVNTKQARFFVEKTREKLSEKYSDINWHKSLDSGIYNGGRSLRMIGSCSKKTNLVNELPFYRPIENGEYLDINLDYLMKTTIRTETPDPQIALMIYDPEFVEKEKELDVNDDIINNYLDEIKDKFPNNDLNITKIKKFFYTGSSSPNICIGIKGKFCPFVERAHKRSSSPLYLNISKYGCSMKCHDEDCEQSKFPDKPIKLNKEIKDAYFNEEETGPNPDIENIPENYSLTIDIINHIETSLSGTHFDIAKFVYFMYKDRFRVDTFKQATWYEFKNHRLYRNSNRLGILLSEDLVWYYSLYIKQVCESKKNDTVSGIISELKNVTFKNNVIAEASNLFYHNHSDFLQKMDSNPDLICFSNGILNLDTLEFRDGHIEDCITLSTKNEYLEYDPKDKKVIEVYKFFKELFPDPEVLDYQMKKISQCLSGRNQQHFNIWTGNGCFGIDTLVKLYDGTMKKVQDINFGDILIGNDYTARKVLDVFRGQDLLYRLNFEDGKSIIVNQEHKLVLKQNTRDDIRIIKMKDFNYQGYFFTPKNEMSKIVSVDSLGMGDYYGFEVSGNHLFLGENNWVLSNSNGKSKLCELIQKAFGEYWAEMPVALLTKQRNNSSSASPEVMKLKGRRAVTVQEPELKDKLNMGLVKHLTGGDPISAREMYKAQEEFRLQSKLFLCCNFIPVIENSDDGTWRRIKIVPFDSKFVANPTRDHEFKIDYGLERKINEWGSSFLSILVFYYKKLSSEGVIEPFKVKEFTKEFKKDSDIFTQFLEDCLEFHKGVTPTDEIYKCFQDWCSNKNIANKAYTKTEIRKLLGDTFGQERKYMDKDTLIRGFNAKIIEDQSLL